MLIPTNIHRSIKLLKTIGLGLLIAVLLCGSLLEANHPGLAAPDGPRKIFLPVVSNDTRSNKPPVMLGIYPNNWWAPNPQGVIDNEFKPMDAWAGKHISLAGVFHHLQNGTEYNVNYQLAVMWDNGYTPFVNLYADVSAYTVARGGIDAAIHSWAKYYAEYAKNGARTAFLAPLQEMNGNWVPYGLDPVNFKIAFRRIRDIFKQEGVPEQSTYWVFAPNGGSVRGAPPIADYYPGDDVVDVVAFSSYNYGYHPKNHYKGWLYPKDAFAPYIDILRTIAPSKPIFVAQTGTTAYSSNGYDVAAKNQWLIDGYNYLADEPGVQAILYYNANIDYDWAIYSKSNFQFDGFTEGAKNPGFDYVPPVNLNKTYSFR